jgi:hypothetical protein
MLSRTLQAVQKYDLIQPRGTKKLVLEVDALGYWMATNNDRDKLRKQDYFARFGPEQGLTRTLTMSLVWYLTRRPMRR